DSRRQRSDSPTCIEPSSPGGGSANVLTIEDPTSPASQRPSAADGSNGPLPRPIQALGSRPLQPALDSPLSPTLHVLSGAEPLRLRPIESSRSLPGWAPRRYRESVRVSPEPLAGRS